MSTLHVSKQTAEKKNGLHTLIQPLRKRVICSRSAKEMRASIHAFFDLALLQRFRDGSHVLKDKQLTEKIHGIVLEMLHRISPKKGLKWEENLMDLCIAHNPPLSSISGSDLIHGHMVLGACREDCPSADVFFANRNASQMC